MSWLLLSPSCIFLLLQIDIVMVRLKSSQFLRNLTHFILRHERGGQWSNSVEHTLLSMVLTGFHLMSAIPSSRLLNPFLIKSLYILNGRGMRLCIENIDLFHNFFSLSNQNPFFWHWLSTFPMQSMLRCRSCKWCLRSAIPWLLLRPCHVSVIVCSVRFLSGRNHRLRIPTSFIISHLSIVVEWGLSLKVSILVSSNLSNQIIVLVSISLEYQR
jgi:hypothetical protein